VIDSLCESEVKKNSSSQYDISQGYLIATRGITVRVRKSVKLSNQKTEYYFTLKATTGGRAIEVEKKLDKRDFDDLWNIALNRLEKTRYIINSFENTWEIDFFRDYKEHIYMAIAEVELPEDQYEPHDTPDVVKENLLYVVPLTDTRFSNKLLGDARYASQLLTEIRKEIDK
jgi:CYTH domain-containing protein